MDKYLRKLILIFLVIIGFFSILIAIFAYFYKYSTLYTYNFILLILMLTSTILLMLLILSGISVFYTYKSKKVVNVFVWLTRIGLRTVLPFAVFISGMFKSGILNNSKDEIRKIYIDVNNILVEYNNKKYKPEDMLILLPHCLQNSECTFKVTNSISNCRECGKCCIGEIVRISTETGVPAVIVTGGTVARKIIAQSRPKMVVSVACERDLTSGISDIRHVPVIGILNKRPNGPCFNTTLDTSILKSKISSIILV